MNTNTIANELNVGQLESAEAVLSRRQAEEAICELNAYELALVGGGGGAMILE